MKRWMKSEGFVLAESIISLAIVSVTATLLLSCYQGIHCQQKRLGDELTAARLAKEATDCLVESGRKVVTVRHQHWLARAYPEVVEVYRGSKMILRVQP